MKIRRAKREDVNEILEIYHLGLLDEFKQQFPKKNMNKIKDESKIYNWKRAEVISSIRSEKNFIIVVEDGGIILGFSSSKILKNKIGLLDKVYVKREFRRRGFARKLVGKALSWLIKNSKDVRVNIFVNNKPSIKLFESFGFVSRHVNFELLNIK